MVSVANFLKIKGESGSVLTITVLNVNLVGSKDDGFERLWVLTRINGVKTTVGVAYFPNDGIDKPLTDKLFYELLENCPFFHSKGYEICLTGDFNGRCLGKCEFTDKTVSSENKQSYNGVRLLQFTDAAELSIANSMNCSEGFFTRIVNDRKSAIDYIALKNYVQKCRLCLY